MSDPSHPWETRAWVLISASAILAGCNSPPDRAQPDASAVTGVATASEPNAEHSIPLGSINSSSNAPPSKTSPANDQAQTQAQAATCADLRADIRSAQNTIREAPTTSIDEDIVAATQGKADKKIADLQAQYEQLDCPAADLPPAKSKAPVLPPAPGALPP